VVQSPALGGALRAGKQAGGPFYLSWLASEEPATRNQEQGTRNKEPRTRNQEQGTKNKEPRTRNQEQGTKNKEPRTRNKEQGTRNKEPRTRNQEQGTKNQEPRTKNQEQRTKNKEPRTRNQEPGILDIRLPSIEPHSMKTLLEIPVFPATIPENFESTIEMTRAELDHHLRLMAALKMFELGQISTGKAAELIGISRVDFLQTCGRYRVSAFNYPPDEIEAEIRSQLKAFSQQPSE